MTLYVLVLAMALTAAWIPSVLCRSSGAPICITDNRVPEEMCANPMLGFFNVTILRIIDGDTELPFDGFTKGEAYHLRVKSYSGPFNGIHLHSTQLVELDDDTQSRGCFQRFAWDNTIRIGHCVLQSSITHQDASDKIMSDFVWHAPAKTGNVRLRLLLVIGKREPDGDDRHVCQWYWEDFHIRSLPGPDAEASCPEGTATEVPSSIPRSPGQGPSEGPSDNNDPSGPQEPGDSPQQPGSDGPSGPQGSGGDGPQGSGGDGPNGPQGSGGDGPHEPPPFTSIPDDTDPGAPGITPGVSAGPLSHSIPEKSTLLLGICAILFCVAMLL